MQRLTIKGKVHKFPIYLPDATRGVVRSIDSDDLKETGIDGIVVNTYHLLSEPGLETLDSLGGIKNFMNFDGLVVSDSGGFQVLSLIAKNKSLGKITDEGLKFYLSTTGQKQKFVLTPEDSIRVQFFINPDIMICLDDCPGQNSTEDVIRHSVTRTIAWAKRCKVEFDKQLKERKIKDANRPLLFAVIQGGSDKNLRKYCAEELIKIGFDGYCFGGWPMIGGKVNYDILKFTADLMPDDKPKFALGVGSPEAIVKGTEMGYDILDCVLPTRDARHHRLYIFDSKSNKMEYMYINKTIYKNDQKPVSKDCNCHTCKNYSRAYMRHLFKIGDSLAWRLATIHNLTAYADLIRVLRG
ncbi:tRNA guanosine(34) transglycosylase Tgt [Patescibacteria group bacterium]|nr:tRNA guanosine(34) transglycosylase Tgt [Patescibacteria group bacterium]